MDKIYNEYNKEKSRKGLVIINIILLLLVIGLVLFILYDKKILFNKEEKVVEIKSDLNSEQLKIYNEFELVYNAEYAYEVNQNSYTDTKNNIRYYTDIVIPYININSEDAKNINEDIKKLNDSLVKEYENNLINNEYYVKSNYSYVIYDDILSLVVKITRNDEKNQEYNEYKTYNINLDTKKKMTYLELLNSLTIKEIDKKMTKKNIETLETEAIKEKTLELIEINNIETKEEYTEEIEDKKTKTVTKTIKQKDVLFSGLTLDEWITSCTNDYLVSKKENNNIYFIDNEGYLNIVVKVFNGKKEYSCNEVSILKINGEIYKNSGLK